MRSTSRKNLVTAALEQYELCFGQRGPFVASSTIPPFPVRGSRPTILGTMTVFTCTHSFILVIVIMKTFETCILRWFIFMLFLVVPLYISILHLIFLHRIKPEHSTCIEALVHFCPSAVADSQCQIKAWDAD